MIITHAGRVQGLCETCCSSDCTNPIENMMVSEVGIKTKKKVCMRNNIPGIVVECEGYSGKDDEMEEEE